MSSAFCALSTIFLATFREAWRASSVASLPTKAGSPFLAVVFESGYCEGREDD